jgi:L-ascorbate metabolism protein UlaG (beta-lactamase superfamily)
MIITYHGADFFKVSFGDTTIAVNPISKDSSIKGARFGSDITLISLVNSTEHNGADVTSRGDKESFVIKGPGEYEVSGVFIKGFLSKSNYEGKERINTVYTVFLEGITLGFLGALSDNTLSPEAKEALDEIDILFIPIGAGNVLDPAVAHKLSVQFGAKIIIPSHFDIGDKNSLKTFLKESGAENTKPVDKITLKKKDLDGKEGEVIILDIV